MIEAVVTRLVPNQAGVLWIGLFVMLLTFLNYKRLLSARNFALAGLLMMAPLFVDLIHWTGGRAATFFSLIYLVTFIYAAWALFLGMKESSISWTPNLPERGNLLVLFLVITLNAVVIFGRAPDDAGIYTNLGAQRWVETGGLPYGDPKLKGVNSPAHGAAATYGPLLYTAHIPAQWLLGAAKNPPEADPRLDSYIWPPILASQVTCFLFQLLGLFALYSIVSKLKDRNLGIAAATLYAGSPYVLGLGGEEFLAGGLVYISHIAPAAATLLAFMMIHRPFFSGFLLATAAGLLYYPAFFFPLWLGWWYWNSTSRSKDSLKFLGGFVVAGAAIATLVVMYTPDPEGTGAISLFLESTLEHQEGSGASEYGLSKFGFWGNHPELAAFWHKPIVGSGSLFKPTFLLFVSLCIAAFFLVRGRSVAQFAALTAMLAAALQLWKSHASGTYVEWYYPFLLIALLASRPSCSSGINSTSHSHKSLT